MTARGTAAQSSLGVRGLLLAVLLVMLGNGLLRTVLGLRAEGLGFSTTTIGIVMSGYYAGFLLGAWGVPKLVVNVGHVRVYAALASLASTATLVHVVTDVASLWTVMRVVTGFSLAGLYIIAESWLNDSATNETRGRLMSVYMVVVMGGVAISQTFLTLADPSGPLLFVLSSILVSVAVIPIAISVAPAPQFNRPTRIPFRTIWEAAPVGIVGGLGQGLTVGAFGGLAAVYASRVGMSVGTIAVFVGGSVAGSVILQWPIGILSDRIRRRRALLLVATAAGGASVTAALVDPTTVWIIVAVFFVGGFTYPLYSLALSHINDVAPEGTSVAVSSLVVFVTGVGAIVGPVLAAIAMDRIGPSGLFWMLAAVHLTVAVFSIIRIIVREGMPVGAQKAFANVPSWSSQLRLERRRGVRSSPVDRRPTQSQASGSGEPSKKGIVE